MNLIPLLKTKIGKILITIIISTVLIISVVLIVVTNSNSKNNTESRIKQEHIQRKVNETKEWVYDADYGFDNKVLKNQYNDREVFYSNEELIAPYININSKYADIVNNEIKEMYIDEYNKFANIGYGRYYSNIKYSYFYNDDVLSVTIINKTGLLDAGAKLKYTIYNFNLNTLDKASLEDCYKAAGYASKEQLDLSIETTISNEIKNEHLLSDVTWNYDELFIDKDSKINLVVPSPSGNIKHVTIEKQNSKKIVTATILVTNNSNESKGTITSKDVTMSDETFEVYKKVINSEGIQKKIKEEYSELTDIELEHAKDTELIKFIYECKTYTEDECIDIVNKYISEFSNNIKENYNAKVIIVDKPIITTRVLGNKL